eukprot:13311927-Alexandrium_andersonii.AAC.1
MLLRKGGSSAAAAGPNWPPQRNPRSAAGGRPASPAGVPSARAPQPTPPRTRATGPTRTAA